LIPEAIGQLSNLEELYLSRNEITEEIPQATRGLQKLRKLALYDMRLPKKSHKASEDGGS
jgi:Leucine-rich repeat (LRR) protein